MTTVVPSDTASGVVKSADTTPRLTAPADEVLISARKHCRDTVAYDRSAAEYACGFCGILRPDVRVAHACEHAICEPCAAECARVGKPCKCAQSFWLWPTPGLLAASSTADDPSCVSASTSPTSSSSSPPASSPNAFANAPLMYTHASAAAVRALQHLVFACPNACDPSVDIKFGDLTSHCLGDTCLGASVECGDCKRRVRVGDKTVHSRECSKRLVLCLACGTTGIQYCELEVHRANSCPRTVVYCPAAADCAVQLYREDVTRHLADTCLYQVVPCVAARFGCGFSGRRRHLDAHVADHAAQHLHLSVRSHVVLQERVDALSVKLAELTAAASVKDSDAAPNCDVGSSSGRGDDAKTASGEKHEVGEGKTSVPQNPVVAAANTAVVVVAPVDVPTSSSTLSSSSSPPSSSSSSPPGSLCAIDLPVSEMKRRLADLMLREATKRPAVLVADKSNRWYVASLFEGGTLLSPSSAQSDKVSAGADRDRLLVAQFDGFPDDEEAVALTSGRVRPLFASPEEHRAFLDGLRERDVVDCRVLHQGTMRWAPCTVTWRLGNEIGVQHAGHSEHNGVHTVDASRSHFLPLGVASRLSRYSTDAFPPHTA